MDVALDPARNDFGVAMVALGELDQRRDQQRLALHQAQHVCSLEVVVNGLIIVARGVGLNCLRGYANPSPSHSVQRQCAPCHHGCQHLSSD